MNLTRLSEPFPAEDIEWRVARAGVGGKGIFCMTLAYITARAIQERLDEVCGPGGWKTEPPQILTIPFGGKTVSAFAFGLSLCIENDWITKWDVAEPTQVEPAKGGWSGAMKRAGAQWGIGRYLYYLDEVFAEVVETQPIGAGRAWNYAKLPDKQGGGKYWWKTPSLPAWALPKDPEHEVSADQLNGLKRDWRAKFAPDVKNPKDLREGFAQFVLSVVGDFPSADSACWTLDALERCAKRIADTTEPGGVSADVPFE